MNRIALLLLCLAPAALPQEKTMTCNDGDHWGDSAHFCEIRETTVVAAGQLNVDGGQNGGISVKGANRADILVRAKVQTSGNDDADARGLASQVQIEAAGARVRAVGPSTSGRRGWSVSFEIFVPNKTGLELQAHNGGISISDVQGRVSFTTVNGGVSLRRLAGTVEGHTTNGGVHLELASDHWEGDRCDVATTNGGVTIQIPSNYSAHLETSTVNGGMRVDFPVTVQGEVNRHLAVDLGSGGNLIRATTTNGGITVERSM